MTTLDVLEFLAILAIGIYELYSDWRRNQVIKEELLKEIETAESNKHCAFIIIAFLSIIVMYSLTFASISMMTWRIKDVPVSIY